MFDFSPLPKASGPNLCMGVSHCVFQGLKIPVVSCHHYTTAKNNNLNVASSQTCNFWSKGSNKKNNVYSNSAVISFGSHKFIV